MNTKMHNNSLNAYGEEKVRLSKRARLIFDWFVANSGAHTDRFVQISMGFSERGMVQPRITELIKAGHLEEVGSTKCGVTGKNVRVVSIARPKKETQEDMFK